MSNSTERARTRAPSPIRVRHHRTKLSNMADQDFDKSRAAALSRQVGTDFGASLTVALAYIGERVGLWGVMAGGSSMTSAEIAEKAGLNERYVREWAATMASAGYLEYRAADATFRMSREQAMVLAFDNNTFFSAGTFQYAVACYRQIDKLIQVFRSGGGVPFADFGPEIAEAIERLFRPGYEAWVVNEWIPAAPGLTAKLASGAVVAAFPNSRFTGFDLDATSIGRACEKAASLNLSDRLGFERGAAENIPTADGFDLVMAFNCIHDMANPRGALANIRRVLKPGGVLMW